jgi:hypothetical protein
VHVPHSQSEAEEEEAMMGGLWVLAMCVLRALVFCKAHTHIMCTKKLANNGMLRIAGKAFLRQTNLLHLIKVNL